MTLALERTADIPQPRVVKPAQALPNAAAVMEQLDQQRRRVDFDTYDITVQQLIAMVDSGHIDVAPAYQRQFRWEQKQRAQLIESVFLGIPVPSLFMATNRDGTWELVDGVQRLSTLVQFAGTPESRRRLELSEPLMLSELTKLTEMNGSSFAQLPTSLRLQFSLRPVKVITLSDKSDLAVRFDLFERLNTGGVALSNQEIRACIFRGAFNDFLERLAQSSHFQKVVRLPKSQMLDGTREECVLRFFAFLHKYKTFDHSVVEFLNNYMKEASSTFDFEENEQLFEHTFANLARVLPRGIVRSEGRSITPINLFEGVAVGAALAIKKAQRINGKGVARWISSAELKALTTGATNSKKTVAGRIEYCRDRFLEK